jgi:hypothetical protein
MSGIWGGPQVRGDSGNFQARDATRPGGHADCNRESLPAR